MRKWIVKFKDGTEVSILADRRYEAVIKAGVSVGLGGYGSKEIQRFVKSATPENSKRGRPRTSIWNEKSWEKEMGNE